MAATRDLDAARMWQAVRARDTGADGRFVYAVRSTGVFCRPSCASRLPRRENVEFFPGAPEARRAGYRACLRCEPERVAGLPGSDAVVMACRLLEGDEPIESREVARRVGLSPEHFQRRFKREIGIAPQAYRRRVLAERAKRELGGASSVLAAAYTAGYRSPSRFYEGAARELGMSGRASRTGAEGVEVFYATRGCSLGRVLVAWTARGLCHVALGDRDQTLVEALVERHPRATNVRSDLPSWASEVVELADRPGNPKLPVDVRGTAFQERVWRALRQIPPGETRSYAEIARAIGAPASVRAVASACAQNPLALVIPCHRAVRSDGTLAGYRWGLERKRALLAREASSGDEE